MTEYGPDLFAGTARYYAKFRPKYPPQLFNDIVQYFDLDGRGRMLDLGSGTGELAIPLAVFFARILALDPEPGMLAEGRRKTVRAGITNIEWRKDSAESLTRLREPFTVVGIGQALHWMDERKVLEDIYHLLVPGGGVFIVGSGGQDQSTPQNAVTGRKNAIVDALLRKFLGPARRAGSTTYRPSGLSWEDDLLPNSKFGGFEKRIYRTTVVRSVEEELGNLYSMSWARRVFFNDKIRNF